MAGVTATGFVPETIDEIISDLDAAFRLVFGDAVNVDPRSRNGQLIATFASPLSDVWEAGEAISQLFNPNGATGQGLDNISAITGTTRLPASKSQIVLTLTGTPTTTVTTGRIASVLSTLSKFATLADATIIAVSAWVGAIPYSLGQRARNGSTQRVYQVITAGTSEASGGPTTTADDITDGTVHWRYLGDGTGAIDVTAEATITGPVQGYSGTVTTIDTAVSGWAGVINVLDAAPGNDREADANLRARRVNELGGQGSSPLPAIRASILRVAAVTSCTIFENTTDATVGTLTPHSFEAVVEGGDDQAILDAIFASKSGGIETIGTTSGNVTDASGESHAVKFSRPVEVDLYVAVALTKDPTAYPSDGDTQVKDKIVEIGNAQRLGRDAIGIQLASVLFPKVDDDTAGVPGVFNVTELLVDTANPPLTTSVVLTSRQRAAYDTSRITVVSIDGEP